MLPGKCVQVDSLLQYAVVSFDGKKYELKSKS